MGNFLPVIGDITSAIISESWLRYFVLLTILAADSAIGNFFGGTYPLTDLLSFAIANVLGIQGFAFPTYFGVSSLLILMATMPVIIFLVKMANR